MGERQSTSLVPTFTEDLAYIFNHSRAHTPISDKASVKVVGMFDKAFVWTLGTSVGGVMTIMTLWKVSVEVVGTPMSAAVSVMSLARLWVFLGLDL